MAQQTIPLDPDSPRGKELAHDLTLLLEEIEENIAHREREQQADAGDAPERSAA